MVVAEVSGRAQTHGGSKDSDRGQKITL